LQKPPRSSPRSYFGQSIYFVFVPFIKNLDKNYRVHAYRCSYEENTREIKRFCQEIKLALLAKIFFDEKERQPLVGFLQKITPPKFRRTLGKNKL
jgi:hypothetical protein